MYEKIRMIWRNYCSELSCLEEEDCIYIIRLLLYCGGHVLTQVCLEEKDCGRHVLTQVCLELPWNSPQDKLVVKWHMYMIQQICSNCLQAAFHSPGMRAKFLNCAKASDYIGLFNINLKIMKPMRWIFKKSIGFKWLNFKFVAGPNLKAWGKMKILISHIQMNTAMQLFLRWAMLWKPD